MNGTLIRTRNFIWWNERLWRNHEDVATVMQTEHLVSVVVLRVFNHDRDNMLPRGMKVNVVVYKVGLKTVHCLANIKENRTLSNKTAQYHKTKTVQKCLSYNLHNHIVLTYCVVALQT